MSQADFLELIDRVRVARRRAHGHATVVFVRPDIYEGARQHFEAEPGQQFRIDGLKAVPREGLAEEFEVEVVGHDLTGDLEE